MAQHDFASTTKNSLKNQVRQVEPRDNWTGHAADQIGDTVNGTPDVREAYNLVIHAVSEADSYEQHVVDANNASAAQIDTIWAAVNDVAAQYLLRFAAIRTDLDGFIAALDNLASIIDPSGANFTTANINGKLKAGIATYDDADKALQQISGTGMNEAEITALGEKNPDALAFVFQGLSGTTNALNAPDETLWEPQAQIEHWNLDVPNLNVKWKPVSASAAVTAAQTVGADAVRFEHAIDALYGFFMYGARGAVVGAAGD